MRKELIILSLKLIIDKLCLLLLKINTHNLLELLNINLLPCTFGRRHNKINLFNFNLYKICTINILKFIENEIDYVII